MVKYSKPYRFKSLPYIVVLLIIFGSIFVTAYYSGITRRYCSKDTACFLEKAKSCKPAEVYTTQNNNVYQYRIYPTPTKTCIMKIELKKVQEGSLPEHQTLLEGKSMKCKIPKKEIKTLNLNNLNNIIPYCSGPLKESMYELIIKRMYELIITNLGEITAETKSLMKV